MPDIAGGTPRSSMLVAELNGERYHVAQQGGRAWEVSRVPAQEADTVREYAWPLNSFHEGAGFSFDGLPYTYDYANGWDASTPGKLKTWARYAVGETKFTTDYPGKITFLSSGHGLMMLRGRYAYKYTMIENPGTTWTGSTSNDFGAGMAVSGRPIPFKGNYYVPVVNASTGAPQRFWQFSLSTGFWTQGPVGVTARAFVRWKNLLVRVTGNTVETVSGDPMTAADWAGTVEVGDSGYGGTDLVVWDRDVHVLKENGMFSLDENLYTIEELPELATVVDTQNGVGVAKAHGKLLIPHESGLIRWDPNGYRFVGPEQEGALEGDLGKGWGRVMGVVPYGKYAFATTKDSYNNMGAIIGFEPSRGGRGPLIPHVYHTCTGGWFEGLTVVQGQVTDNTWLIAVHVDDDGASAEPWVYQLPKAAMSPANDPTIVHARDSADFYTSRLAAPGRDVKKSFRTLEFWTELNDLTDIPGLQVWASVDGAASIQLLDSAGVAATIKTNGFQRLFFPKTAAAVGHYVQLNFKVPAKSGAEGDVAVTVREAVLRGELHPLMTNTVTAMLVLSEGEFEDKGSMRRTVQKQKADLLALADPTAAAVTYKDPWGQTGWMKIAGVQVQEMTFRGDSEPKHVATVTMRERPYG